MRTSYKGAPCGLAYFSSFLWARSGCYEAKLWFQRPQQALSFILKVLLEGTRPRQYFSLEGGLLELGFG